MAGEVCVDLDQNPARRPRVVVEKEPDGSFGLLPALISHGVYWWQRPLLAYEWGGVHGYPWGKLQQDIENPFSASAIDLLQEGILKHQDYKSMVGLGWHIPSMGSYYYKLLSSIELRRPLKVCKHFLGIDVTPCKRARTDDGSPEGDSLEGLPTPSGSQPCVIDSASDASPEKHCIPSCWGAAFDE